MPQSNQRLTKHNRMSLRKFAYERIIETQDTKKLDAAYDAAAKVIKAAVLRRWPARDMNVLKKYDAAALDRCVYVAGEVGRYELFNFRTDDKRICLRPKYNGCRDMPIQLEDEARQIFDKYVQARKDHEQQIKARQADFYALIYNSGTFNALAEIWPAAEELRQQICGTGTALSVLNDDTVKRIKADKALAAA